jgi:hypothetical protein
MTSTRKRVGLASGVLAGLLAAAHAHAQSAIQPEPSPALGCLSVADGAPREPEFPFDQYKAGQAGRVVAAVTLPGGLFGNRIEILLSEGDPAFVAATRSYLQALKAPCLKRGETATLKYDFVFQRDRRQVVWSLPSDALEEAQKPLATCVRHEKAGSTPEYPQRARRDWIAGRVLGLLRFTSADGPPSVELLHRPSAKVFDAAILDWAAGLRMPCHPGGTVTVSQTYNFRFEGDHAFGFKALTLTQLLASGKGMRKRELALDTTAMGCPFQLKLTYYQPLRRNDIGEVGQPNPERRPLLELLAGLELDLNEELNDSVYADTAEVDVPCVKINLKPKEKSS